MSDDAISEAVVEQVRELLLAHSRVRGGLAERCLPDVPEILPLRCAVALVESPCDNSWLRYMRRYAEQAEHPLDAIPVVERTLREAVTLMLQAVGRALPRPQTCPEW